MALNNQLVNDPQNSDAAARNNHRNNRNNAANNNNNNNGNDNNENGNNENKQNVDDTPFEFPNSCFCSHANRCHVWRKVRHRVNHEVEDVSHCLFEWFHHASRRTMTGLETYGRPAEEYKAGTEITDIANSIFAEELAYKLIRGTNKRARDYNDTKYTPIPETTDGIKKIKGYFAVLIGSAIKGNIPIEDIYCQIEGVGDRWLASFMDEKDFTAINRNIKWVCDDDIPDAYVGHPY